MKSIEVGTTFKQHYSMAYSVGKGKQRERRYHEFDTDCVVTEVDALNGNAKYDVTALYNETGKPEWQTAERTVTKGGFALRFHEIVDGWLEVLG
jgi:hypothetical protein